MMLCCVVVQNSKSFQTLFLVCVTHSVNWLRVVVRSQYCGSVTVTAASTWHFNLRLDDVDHDALKFGAIVRVHSKQSHAPNQLTKACHHHRQEY